jgi:putative tricarboxylic transport membrane protein
MVAKQIGWTEGVFWTAIGVIVCVLALKFDLGSFTEPGPGFVAFFAGLLLCGLGLIMIVSGLFTRRQAASEEESAGATPWARLLYTLSLLLGYVLFLNSLGYVLCTFFLLWGMTYDRKKKNLLSSLLFSGITVLVSFLVFETWLRCQLPRGFFPWW